MIALWTIVLLPVGLLVGFAALFGGDPALTVVLAAVFFGPLTLARAGRRSYRSRLAVRGLVAPVVALAERKPHAALEALRELDGTESVLTIATARVLAEWARADGAKGDIPELLRLRDDEREALWPCFDSVRDAGSEDPPPVSLSEDGAAQVASLVARRGRTRRGDGLVEALTLLTPALRGAGRLGASAAASDLIDRVGSRRSMA